MTLDELRALPVAVDLTTAGRAWGTGRNKIYELARAGKAPFPVRRLGNAYRVTRADLLRSLGIDPDTATDPGDASGPLPRQERPRTTPIDPEDVEVCPDGNRHDRRPTRLRAAQ